MPDHARLEALLRRIDDRQYPAYKDLKGTWRLDGLEITVDYVQGDPFARPSRLRLRVATGIAPEICADPDARVAAEDWLLRRFASALTTPRRGSGRSGELLVYQPGPEIVERSAVALGRDGTAEVRFQAGLPAQGRRILGRAAWWMLSEDVVHAGRVLAGVGGEAGLETQVRSVRAQRQLRRQLRDRGLVAFVADGAILPRATGVSEDPLPGALPFRSPDSLRVSLDTEDGPVTGMGVGVGITLVVGGGFHGKSTLLRALQRGHLDHVPGDGRERVVADPDTVKIRAEDGRRVEKVDIGNFLRELPGGRSTRPFSTDDASGSTSQAAAIVEAVESGARVLLLDEDTSATNLMVRDERMRALVPRALEPITPLVERVRAMHTEWGLSLVIVIGGVSDYLGVADRVVAMDNWCPRDVTDRARAIAAAPVPMDDALPPPLARRIRGSSLVPRGKGQIRARDERRIDYGSDEIDLRAVEQVLDGPHAATLGEAIRVGSRGLRGSPTLPQLLDGLEATLREQGLDALSPFAEPSGWLAWPRRHEVAAALNRLRNLVVEG